MTDVNNTNEEEITGEYLYCSFGTGKSADMIFHALRDVIPCAYDKDQTE